MSGMNRLIRLTESRFKSSCFEPLKGHGGWLRVVLMKSNDPRRSEELAVLVCDGSGYSLSGMIGEEMMLVPATESDAFTPCPFPEVLEKDLTRFSEAWLSKLQSRLETERQREIDKLNRAAEDLKQALELEIRSQASAAGGKRLGRKKTPFALHQSPAWNAGLRAFRAQFMIVTFCRNVK